MLSGACFSLVNRTSKTAEEKQDSTEQLQCRESDTTEVTQQQQQQQQEDTDLQRCTTKEALSKAEIPVLWPPHAKS